MASGTNGFKGSHHLHRIIVGTSATSAKLIYVDYLEFDFGNEESVKFGASSSQTRETISLKAGDPIVEVFGLSGDAIDTLNFRTQSGHVFGPYGKAHGNPFSHKAPAGQELTGFESDLFIWENKILLTGLVIPHWLPSASLPQDTVVSDYGPTTETFFNLLKVETYTYHTILASTHITGWATATVYISNVGKVPITNVKASIGSDDDSPFWDVILVDNSGAPIPGNKEVLTFENLAPGQKSLGQNFWFSLAPLASGVRPPAVIHGKLNVIPQFTVNFSGYGVDVAPVTITLK